MVTTSHIAPNPILSAYVSSYILRHFDTEGAIITRPWLASYYTSITFFFKAKLIHLRDPIHKEIVKTGDCINIFGLSSAYNGEMTFKGCYLFLEIIFKPTGLNEIFGIPLPEIRNHIIDGRDLLQPDIQSLYERLCAAKDLREMGLLADAYLLHYLLKSSPLGGNKNLRKIVDFMVNGCGKANLDLLSVQAHMSNRNLERFFTTKLGISPKHLTCLIRFNRALSLKREDAMLKWTSIAAECNYFDQMHMIREFKNLSGNTPCHLMKIPLVMETEEPIILIKLNTTNSSIYLE
ncbi:MAG: helix-turn-helix domain-containing protein [Gelidibacter sp.]